MPDQFCRWEHTGTPRSSEGWRSGCGEVYLFPDGGPLKYRWRYCPFCAKPIQQEDGADE